MHLSQALAPVRFARLWAFLLALMPVLALAGEAPSHPAILTLSVNDVEHGDVIVLLRGDDVLVGADDLAATGLRLPPVEREWIQNRLYVPLSALAPAVRYQKDLAGARLRLSASAEQLGRSVIDLRGRAPSGIVYRDDTSAFLNYAPRLLDGKHFEAYGEAGLSHGGALLFSGVSYTLDQEVVRGLSNFTYDDRERLHRWVVGDLFQNTGALGSQRLVSGLTFSRTFALDPYRTGAPGLDYTGSVDTPATVDVYVNDALVKSESIPAGTFQLENIPVQTGAGEVRYVVRDVFGNRQQFGAAYYQARGALAAGETEFAYTLGLPRNRFGRESFDYDTLPVLMGRQRIGLTSGLTGGWAFEGALNHASGGPSLSIGTAAGAIDMAAAGSVTDGEAGAAGFLGYSFVGRRAAISSYVRGATHRYSTLGLLPDDDRKLLDGTLSLSVSLARWATASAQQTAGWSRDNGRSLGSTVSLGLQFHPAVHLLLTGARSESEVAGPPVLEAFGTLSLSFDAGVTARVGGRTVDGEQHEGTVGVSKALPPGTGAGFDANAAYGDHLRLNLVGLGQASFGRLQGTYYQLDDEIHTVLEPSGGIVYVAGAGVFLSRPVQQGYAVVEVPGAEGVRVSLDNHVIGTTNADGMVLVPDLVPYYGNRLSVNDADLPLDRQVGEVEQVIATRPRGGAHVRMTVERAHFVRGRLTMRTADAEEVPKYGEVTVRSGQLVATSPIGLAGEFEFADLPPGLYWGVVQSAYGQRCRVRVPVPEFRGPVVDVGSITCTAQAEPQQAGVRSRKRTKDKAAQGPSATEQVLAELRQRIAERREAKPEKPVSAPVAEAPQVRAEPPPRRGAQRAAARAAELRQAVEGPPPKKVAARKRPPKAPRTAAPQRTAAAAPPRAPAEREGTLQRVVRTAGSTLEQWVENARKMAPAPAPAPAPVKAPAPVAAPAKAPRWVRPAAKALGARVEAARRTLGSVATWLDELTRDPASDVRDREGGGE